MVLKRTLPMRSKLQNRTKCKKIEQLLLSAMSCCHCLQLKMLSFRVCQLIFSVLFVLSSSQIVYHLAFAHYEKTKKCMKHAAAVDVFKRRLPKSGKQQNEPNVKFQRSTFVGNSVLPLFAVHKVTFESTPDYFFKLFLVNNKLAYLFTVSELPSVIYNDIYKCCSK